MDNFTVEYEVFRVNPFIPSLPTKGKPLQFTLMPASLYRELLKYYKNKKHEPFPANGGFVRATIMNDGARFGVGEATCSMSDVFDAQIGMKLAFDRALEDTNKHVKIVNNLMQLKLTQLTLKGGPK